MSTRYKTVQIDNHNNIIVFCPRNKTYSVNVKLLSTRFILVLYIFLFLFLFSYA